MRLQFEHYKNIITIIELIPLKILQILVFKMLGNKNKVGLKYQNAIKYIYD